MKRIETLLYVIMIASLLFLAFAIAALRNYPHWVLFSLTIGFFGFIISVALYEILCVYIPECKTYKTPHGHKLYVHTYISVTFICFWLATFLNQNWSRSLECKTYRIKELVETHGRNKKTYVVVYTSNGTEKLNFGSDFNQQHQAGEYIPVSLITGCLGFTYYETGCPY